jgi:GWxTD domain-containing protein
VRTSGAIILVVMNLLLCSAEHARSQDSMFGAERSAAFDLSVRQVFDEENRSVMVLTASIPYSRLVFLLKEDRYVANYRVFMELRPKRGDGMRGEVWEEAVIANDYRDTQSGGTLSTSRRSFAVEPGDYRIKVSIEVVDTSLRFQREKDIRIVGHGQDALMVSEPVFMVPGAQTPVSGPLAGEMRISLGGEGIDERFVLSPTATYHGFDIWTRIVYSVVGPFTGDSLAVAARITDTEGHVLRYGHRVLTGTGSGHMQLYLDFVVDDFSLGEYLVEASVMMPKSGTWVHAEGRFRVLFTRSSFFTHFDQTIEILSIIAREGELDELKQALPEERFAAWQRFWRKRDLTPSSDSNEQLDEFFTRLSYVMRAFSVLRPGWQTDRGKVFLRHGKPDKIAELTADFGRNYQYWYYYSLGAVYIFQDAFGMGDYRLVSTELL